MRTRRLLLSLVLLVGLLGAITVSASASSCVSYHIVQPGENLFRIGLRYGLTVDQVARANGIVNPNTIYVGQQLCIPGGNVPPPPPPYNPPPGNCTYYTVRAGDTLGSIALRYNTTVYKLQQANNIRNPNLIYVGMRLCIPGSGQQPPAFPQFKAEYFNNASLAGAASVVRNDKAINFDWGVGWPDPRINADNFSVRWTRTQFFQAGTFRFIARADDGIRVFVDNVLLIDEWHAATANTYTAVATLASGNHALRIEYFEATGNASAFFTWERIQGTPGTTPIPGATSTPTSGGGSTLWTGTYFANPDLAGGPAVTRIDAAIAFNWGQGSPDGSIPKDLYSARWVSSQSLQSGTYRFFALVDDGVRIYIDDLLVLDEWFGHNSTTIFADVPVSAGTHTIKVEYFEFGHDAQIYVWWEKR
jgi:LysM repeat protein